MRALRLLHTRTFDAAIDRLRVECFPGTYPTGSAKDEFDDRSTHIVALADEELAAYGRLIPGPDSYFEATFSKQAVLPTGADVVDFGRVMVAPSHRGHDLFELILVEGLILAADLGFRCVVGASRPDRRFRPFLRDLGFSDSGAATLQRFSNGVEEVNQPVVALTAGNRETWYSRKLSTLQRLREKGYEILDDGCGASPASDQYQGFPDVIPGSTRP